MNVIHRHSPRVIAAAVLALAAAHTYAQVGATPSDTAGTGGMQSPGTSTYPNASSTTGGTGSMDAQQGTMGANSGTAADGVSTNQADQGMGTQPGNAAQSDAAGGRYSTELSTLPSEPTAAGPGAGYAGNGYSWLPYTTSGYIGLSVGAGDIDDGCVAGQKCEDPDGAIHVYTGGLFNPNFGLQLGYFRLNDADRNGGKTKISGVNLVLTGIAPLTSTLNLVGRVGGTYGWTDVSAGPGVVTSRGDETGFGASYGAGLAWDFNRNWSVTLDWDRHHMKFPGDDKKNVDVATVGFKYRF